MPTQGATISSDLLIAGPKIYSDASWKNTKIPGRSHLQDKRLGKKNHFVDGAY